MYKNLHNIVVYNLILYDHYEQNNTRFECKPIVSFYFNSSICQLAFCVNGLVSLLENWAQG